MLKTILAITGKPGLFKIVSNGNRMLLVEDVTTGKRFPAHSRDKILSLGDIAMYTEDGDTPLGEILDKVYEKMSGSKINVKDLSANKKLRETFGEIIPNFDRDRVYDSDIKKLFSWYNILVDAGFSKFAEVKENDIPKEDSTENN